MIGVMINASCSTGGYHMCWDCFIIPQNELLTCLWYLSLECTLRGLEVIQKFNNNDNDEKMNIDDK